MSSPTRLFDRQQGFTLMELTVVLVIVALLLGGLLVPLGAQRDVESMRATEKSLADIREALIGFAAINGRLPCPAEATLQGTNPSGANYSANAGIEATTGSGSGLTCACTTSASDIAGWASACNGGMATSVTGVLPWATLGLLETDAWGRRYTYRVNTVFSRGVDPAPTTSSTFGTGCALTLVSDMPTKAAFALCTQGDITIRPAFGSGTTLASSVPAVVVSHGGNGLGAYTSFATQLTAAASGTDEFENSNGDSTFVGNTTIDDRLVWIPTSQLMNRMMTAGKLP